jgi:hypothetical protein
MGYVVTIVTFIICSLPIAYEYLYLHNPANLDLMWEIDFIISKSIIFILSFIIFRLISYRKSFLKLMTFVLSTICFMSLMDAALTTDFYDMSTVSSYRYTFLILYVLIILPEVVFLNLRYRITDKDLYNVKETFIAYRYPDNVIKLIYALFTAPYSQCSVVCKGRHFKFKHGVLIEVPHKRCRSNVYKKVEDADLSELRDMIGMKWTLLNNCFSIFNTYRKQVHGARTQRHRRSGT